MQVYKACVIAHFIYFPTSQKCWRKIFIFAAYQVTAGLPGAGEVQYA